jgi:spermidine/putrescine transport system substrate-binding protein
MCIPKSSKNPELAKEYINFMLSEEIAVANASYIGYASPNTLVSENEDYKAEMEDYFEGSIDLLYGKSPAEVNSYYDTIMGKENASSYRNFTPDIQSRVNTLWENLKLANATEAWIHVVTALILVSVVTLAVYTTYIKKKRSRVYRMRDKEKKLNKS